MGAAGAEQSDERLHLLGIRHHGPGSAALLRQALDAMDPACVLVEGPGEGDELIPYIADAGLKPPVAMLFYATGDANHASFMPFAEFSPEWQAMRWALEHGRPVRFIDWPASVSLALKMQEQEAGEESEAHVEHDALDLLADSAGFSDGETFWNTLIEQHGGSQGQHAANIFRSIETAMTEARAQEESVGVAERGFSRDPRREAFMRANIRAALKEQDGAVAVVCGAWHLSALRAPGKAKEDREVMKGLPRIKVAATWIPWTDSRLSVRSGYGAGVVSPGWYRHLWNLYSSDRIPEPAEFAAVWQARAAHLLRREGYAASTAGAMDATQLALGLAALRGLPMPGLAEMREASLATLCHGNSVPLALIESKLYVGERVGEVGERVPQTPLAHDLALWQRKTRLKPEDAETEMRLDLRSDAGLLKSTLLHRLQLIHVPWGRLVDAHSGRGTFREVWMLCWQPELSVKLAEAVVHGVTIEQAAAHATVEKARSTTSLKVLAGLVQGALVADLPAAATKCIELLQAAAVSDGDITDLMLAVEPLARVLRYGSARSLPQAELFALIVSLAAEIHAGVCIGSRLLDLDMAAARLKAMESYDQALQLFADASLIAAWTQELERMVMDEQVVAVLAGFCLRRLHDRAAWSLERVSAALAFHTERQSPQHAGQFLEGFLHGGSEVILQDEPLLHLLDGWLCSLEEAQFVESLPLLRRSLSSFDAVARRRVMDKLSHGPQASAQKGFDGAESSEAFEAALPLLHKILGLGEPA